MARASERGIYLYSQPRRARMGELIVFHSLAMARVIREKGVAGRITDGMGVAERHKRG